MIYFVQPVEGGPVKIGHSTNVTTRVEQLETHYGKPLALLGTMPGGRPEEQALHSRFAHLRLGKTEQFRPAADLMKFIGKPLLVGANPDAVEAIEVRTAQPCMIRLTDEDRAKLNDLRRWYGVPSVAAAIRLAVEATHRHGPPKVKPPKVAG